MEPLDADNLGANAFGLPPPRSPVAVCSPLTPVSPFTFGHSEPSYAPLWQDFTYNSCIISPIGPSSDGVLATISPTMLQGFSLPPPPKSELDEHMTFPDDDMYVQTPLTPPTTATRSLGTPPPTPATPHFAVKSEPESPFTPVPGLRAVSPGPSELNEVVDLDESQYAPSPRIVKIQSKPSASRPKRGGPLRADPRRMSQNRSAQKKYRKKNKRLGELFNFNVAVLAVIGQVRDGDMSPSKATQTLAKRGYRFLTDMKATCATTGSHLEEDVANAPRV